MRREAPGKTRKRNELAVRMEIERYRRAFDDGFDAALKMIIGDCRLKLKQRPKDRRKVGK